MRVRVCVCVQVSETALRQVLECLLEKTVTTKVLIDTKIGMAVKAARLVVRVCVCVCVCVCKCVCVCIRSMVGCAGVPCSASQCTPPLTRAGEAGEREEEGEHAPHDGQIFEVMYGCIHTSVGVFLLCASALMGAW